MFLNPSPRRTRSTRKTSTRKTSTRKTSTRKTSTRNTRSTRKTSTKLTIITTVNYQKTSCPQLLILLIDELAELSNHFDSINEQTVEDNANAQALGEVQYEIDDNHDGKLSRDFLLPAITNTVDR